MRINKRTLGQVLIVLGALLALSACASGFDPRDAGQLGQQVGDILYSPAFRIPVGLAGLALLLAGLWLAELIIAIPGFIFGALVGSALAATSEGEFGLLSVFGALIGGAVGAWLAVTLFYLGIFLAGFGVGFIAGGSVGAAWFESSDAGLIIGIVLGLFAGALAVALWKTLQIAISAAIGATLIGIAMGWEDQPLILLGLWLFGCAVQFGVFKATGGPKPRNPSAAAPPSNGPL